MSVYDKPESLPFVLGWLSSWPRRHTRREYLRIASAVSSATNSRDVRVGWEVVWIACFVLYHIDTRYTILSIRLLDK